MILVIILTGILQGLGVHDAQLLWRWFGDHLVLTFLLALFLA